PEAASVRAVFVGDEDSAPEINWAPPATIHFDQAVRSGPIADTILEEAEAFDADLIVMATQGRQGFLDALRGSTTDQVVRKAPCPVLAVPTI
ncbi:MAG: universal stress protein, partial [Pseudomonadota bacterium]